MSPHDSESQDAQPGRRLDLRLWLGVFRYALAYRATLAGLAATAVLVAACDTLYPLVTRAVVDDIALGRGREVWAAWGPAYAAITLVLVASVWAFINLAGRIATRVSHDIRRDGFARLQALSFSFYDRRPVGWIVARMTSDCERLAQIVAWGFLDLVWGLSVMLAAGSVLLWLDWRLGGAALLVMPVMGAVCLGYQRRMLESSRQARRTNSLLTAAWAEGIMGVRTTRVLGREQTSLDRFRQRSGAMHAASLENGLQSALFLPLVMAIGSIGTALALAAGGWAMPRGGLSLGTLVAALGYVALFFNPVQELARTLAQMQTAQAAAERVLGLIATEPEVGDSAEVRLAIAARREALRSGRSNASDGLAEDGGRPSIGEIEFRDVTFTYGGSRPVLDRFSLKVRAGETIALVGPTGGGKTTIVSLLCRFYEPTAGEILVDGVDYRRRSLAWLQSSLGVVLQVPHLFSGTVRDNIRYGRLAASDAEVEQAAVEAGADDFIRALPGGYDSQVGEGGGHLSGGLRQLVSIARAILARPQILVLDEATSSVDPETEARIRQALGRVLGGRLSFVIAHRLSTVRAADRILVIDGGRIVEQGTHAELLARAGGRYRELYAGQRAREVVAEGAWVGPGGATA